MALNPSISKVVVPAPPTASANYDYFDIAEGTGIQNFFASQSIASGAVLQPFLTNDESTYSGRVAEKTKQTSQDIKVTSIVDYDVQFQLPKIIADAKIRMSVTLGMNVVAANANQVLLVCELFKVSGGVPEQIGEQAETNIISSIATETKSRTDNMSFTPSGRINFKIGDILRLRVTLHGRGNGGASAQGYGIDPKDRDDESTVSGAIVIESAHTTQLKLAVPFIIDI